MVRDYCEGMHATFLNPLVSHSRLQLSGSNTTPPPQSECPPFLKGQCHEKNNFVEGLKNQISTFCIGAEGFF